MKTKLSIIASAPVALILVLSAQAQETTGAKASPADHQFGEMSSMKRMDRLNAAKASDLVGMKIKSLQGEKLGKLEYLKVDLPAGRFVAVILSSGGFIGMSDELTDAPYFNENERPGFGEPGYVGGVYRGYRVEPYFSTNTTAKADNTRRNVRDRDGQSLPPLNHGNSKADVELTARIRKGIVGLENMSFNKQNLKIITTDGRVMLHGPVNTAEEKRLIGQTAINVVRIENVDNQLEVK